MQKASPVFVGIDVSKARVDVHYHPTGTATWAATDAESLSLLAIAFALRGVERVVMESTGGYSSRVREVLTSMGIPTYVVQPQRIRNFAKALGFEAKTDAIDAKVIALYASMATFVARPAPSSSVVALRDLVVRRQQLVQVRAAERTRREMLPAAVQSGSDELIATLNGVIRQVERAMAAVVRADADLVLRAKVLAECAASARS